MVETERLPLDTAQSLAIGLTAGGASFYVVNRGTLFVLGYLIPSYFLLVGFVYATEWIVEKTKRDDQDDEDEPKPWAGITYAS